MKTKLLCLAAVCAIATAQRIPATARGTVVRADSSTTATLPAANSLVSGDAIEVMCVSTANCTVASAGGLVAGGSSFTVASGITVRFVSDGGGWWVAGGTPKANSDGTLEGISGAAGVGSCIPASSSGTTYTCTVASATYANNLTIAFKPDTTNTGAATVNISSQGAKAILTQGGQTLSAGMLQAALTYLIVYDGTQFRLQGTSWPVPHVDGSLTDDFTAYPPTRRVTAGVFAEIGGANTFTGANSFAGALSTKPVKVGSLLPATCTEGHMFWLTTAPAGQNLYGCTATNTWTLLGAGAKSVVFQAGIGSNSTGNPGGVINGLLFDFLNTDSGTSKPVGLATFPNTGGDAIVSWVYPTTWDTTALTVKLHLVIETNAAGNLTFTPFATCPADGTAFTGLSYTNGTPVTVSAGGVALGTLTVTLTLPTTGCSAGSPVFAGVNRTSGGTDTYEDKAYLTHMEFRGTW